MKRECNLDVAFHEQFYMWIPPQYVGEVGQSKLEDPSFFFVCCYN